MKNVLLAALLLVSIVALILGSAARFGYFPVNAVATPPRLEVTLNQSILQASLSNQAKGLTNPLQPNSDVLLAGMKVFKMNCAGCHGQPGKPSSWGTKGFYPRVPQFADDPPPLAAAEMFVAIKYGIRYSGMGAWDGMMPDEDIWKVATFLEHMNSLPPQVQANWSAAE